MHNHPNGVMRATLCAYRLPVMVRAASDHRAIRRWSSLLLVALIALAAIALGGCGESKQDKAKKTVCEAKADIKTQVQHLSAITPSSAALTEVKNDLTKIGDDLNKIKDAQPDLSPARKQEVEKATQEFATAASSNLSSILTSLSKGEVS